MKKMVFILLAFVILYSANANNIQVTNVTVQPTTNTIQFTVTWDNGWRSAILNNWDAAWIFIKYYNPLAPGWVHLNLASSGNTIPAGFTGTVSPDGVGVFLYRSAVGSGTTTISNVQLAIPSQQASGIFDIKIFAIEMVYVPQGPFYAGDAISGSGRYAGSAAQITPGFISSASGVTAVYDPLCTTCSGGILNTPATFGNGYNAFYCMKYELTQGAYRDFINSLNYSQQVNHVGSALNGSGFWVFGAQNRNWLTVKSPGSSITPAVIACNANGNDGTLDDVADGEWVPCNFLTWVDQAAYLDWAGLRPITELEYEKAGRGLLLPVPGEFAWGNTNISNISYSLTNASEASERVTNASASPTGNAVYVTTDGQSTTDGPFRNGIFATATSNRVSSGGSFYGIMDISGNLAERVISTAGNEINLFISNFHGDGSLTTDGYANNLTGWPGASINGFIVDGNLPATGLIMRGGNWTSPSADLRISNRTSANLIITTDMTRNSYSGVRGGRTAP
jgi:formylglycine-generating enzyme required for sulfatase activity